MKKTENGVEIEEILKVLKNGRREIEQKMKLD
jgi:hypothetical protein